MSKGGAGFTVSRQTSRTDCHGGQHHEEEDEEVLDPRIQV